MRTDYRLLLFVCLFFAVFTECIRTCFVVPETAVKRLYTWTMTWLSFIGCALIAYALPFSMIYFIILRRPQLMIVFLFGFVISSRHFILVTYFGDFVIQFTHQLAQTSRPAQLRALLRELTAPALTCRHTNSQGIYVLGIGPNISFSVVCCEGMLFPS